MPSQQQKQGSRAIRIACAAAGIKLQRHLTRHILTRRASCLSHRLVSVSTAPNTADVSDIPPAISAANSSIACKRSPNCHRENGNDLISTSISSYYRSCRSCGRLNTQADAQMPTVPVQDGPGATVLLDERRPADVRAPHFFARVQP